MITKGSLLKQKDLSVLVTQRGVHNRISSDIAMANK